MSAGRWQRLNAIFHEALALGPDERPAHLSRACAGDPPLRLEAEELLDAHHRSELDPGAIERFEMSLDTLASPAAVGRRFGPYRVSGEIGRGGMGAVWLADRADGQFEQRVAIKLIKRGMDTAQILDRFRVERQILASLDHPHIARLIDGGTTDEGLPYFVMEYIEGQAIDRYADDRRLSVCERLEPRRSPDSVSGTCSAPPPRLSAIRSRAWFTRTRRIITAASPMNCARLDQSTCR